MKNISKKPLDIFGYLGYSVYMLLAFTMSAKAQSVTVSFSITSPATPLEVPLQTGLSNITFDINLIKPHSRVSDGVLKIYAKPDGTQTMNELFSRNIFSTTWVANAGGSGLDAQGFSSNFELLPSQLNNNIGTIMAQYEETGGAKFTSSDINAKVVTPISNNTISANGGPTDFINSGDPNLIAGSTPTGGTGTYTYQWQFSITSASSGFSAISNTNTVNYDPSVITHTTWYRRIITSGTQTSTSNVLTFTVTASISNNVITTSGPTFFEDAGDLTSITGTMPSGGNGTYTYQWQSSTTSSSDGFSNISGATGSSYDPSMVFDNTTYYRRVVTSAGLTGYSNVITQTILKNNLIHFGATQNYSYQYYYSRPVTPPNIYGESITGTTSTIEYSWVESSDGVNWHVVYGNDGSFHGTSSIIQTTYYAREAIIRDAGGNYVFDKLSNIIIAYVFDPITNNSICCSNTVYGNSTPSPVTGSTPTGGNAPLNIFWESSTDGINFTPASGGYLNNGLDYQPPTGLTGNYYVRRRVRDNSPTPYINYSNVVTVTYNNTVPLGSDITNPFNTSTFDVNCQEYLQTVNSLNGTFSNKYGASENDVYFKIITTGTVLNMSTCNSDVNTKLYLFDSNYNLFASSSSQFPCELSLTANVAGTFYLLVEGNGTIRLQLTTHYYSDCSDGYTTFGRIATGNSGSVITSTVSNEMAYETSSLELYPNPATSAISLQLPGKSTEVKKIAIVNKYNDVMKRLETTENNIQISVQDLPSDMYFVEVTSKEGFKVHRLVVK